jgi:hypothetical protein
MADDTSSTATASEASAASIGTGVAAAPADGTSAAAIASEPVAVPAMETAPGVMGSLTLGFAFLARLMPNCSSLLFLPLKGANA